MSPIYGKLGDMRAKAYYLMSENKISVEAYFHIVWLFLAEINTFYVYRNGKLLITDDVV